MNQTTDRNLVLKNLLHLGTMRLYAAIGKTDFRRLLPYIEGYCSCLFRIGLPNDFWEFQRWFFKNDVELWGGDWTEVLLRRSGGDHISALESFLVVVSDYIAAHEPEDEPSLSMSRTINPDKAQGHNPLLENLLRLHTYSLSLLVGEYNFEKLPLYISGFSACLKDIGLPDEFSDFQSWLVRMNPEMQGRGWVEVLLEHAKGDHAQAVKLLLAKISEYLAEKSHRAS
jgi:hypothetical protein